MDADDLKKMVEMMGNQGEQRKMAEEMLGIALPKDECRRMHEMTVRWTTLEYLQYATQIIGPKNPEALKKTAEMVRSLADHLIEHATFAGSDFNKPPSIGWFKALTPCKDPSAED